MPVRGYVTFEDALTPVADLPADDSPPPGRALALELAHGLEAQGLALTWPVSPWESYGWHFTVDVDGRNVWFMLQPSDQWLLMSNTPRSLLERIKRVSAEGQHQKAVEAVARVLAQPRFGNVRWFSRSDFDARGGGADAP